MEQTKLYQTFLRTNVMNTLRYHRKAYQAFLNLERADQDEIIHGSLVLKEALVGMSLGGAFSLLYAMGVWDQNGGDLVRELEARRMRA